MNIQQYLPSKKILITIIVLAIVGLAFGIYYFFSQKQNNLLDTNLVNVTFIDNSLDINNELFKDTDNDGAYDWEEDLWPELDPNNPDSDGDGVLDGRYIQVKRAAQERERLGEDFVESNLTETQKLGRGTLSALIALANSSQEITTETESQISENIEGYIQNLPLGEKIYIRDDFALIENTPENSYAYRDSMQKLFRDYPVATSDIELLIKGTENPNEYQGRLRSANKKYEAYLSELIGIEIPFAIAGRHTELTNNISQISGAINNLLAEEQDELVSLSAIIQLETIMNQTAAAIININTYFEIIDDPSIFQ